MAAPRNNLKAFTDWYELDYFRRPRHPRTKTWAVLLAMLVSAAAVALAWAWPGGRPAFQAGPLSSAHTLLAENCAACHTEPFLTAQRLLPGHSAVRSTPDAACTHCHEEQVRCRFRYYAYHLPTRTLARCQKGQQRNQISAPTMHYEHLTTEGEALHHGQSVLLQYAGSPFLVANRISRIALRSSFDKWANLGPASSFARTSHNLR